MAETWKQECGQRCGQDRQEPDSKGHVHCDEVFAFN